MLYNCGMIFFILSFFVGYILSIGLVRLRTFRLSAQVGEHIERRCSRSRGEDVTITDVIIKPPDRNELGMWMMSCPEAMGWDSWVFWKKQWDLRLDEPSWIWIWAKPVQLFLGTNSQHSKNGVSLSPRVESLKVKKVI